MKYDVIRSVEACYAEADDEHRWLEGLLEVLGPLDGGGGTFACVFDAPEGGDPVIECEVGWGALSEVRASMGRLLVSSADAEVVFQFFAPNPPVAYALKRVSPSIAELRNSARALFRRKGIEDALGVCAAAPGTKTVLVVGAAAGRPLLPPRTLHQLTMLSAHVHSAMRLRRALAGSSQAASPGGAPEAVVDAGGRVLHARGEARSRPVIRTLSEAVRRMDRARGPLRRTDPEEALGLWQGLVDGTWSLVDQCDSDGKRYILARRNVPGVRDPKALSERERAVLAFAAIGHQDKYIGYLLGLSPSTISGHLRSAQRKLGLASRTDLIRRFAPLVQVPDQAEAPQGNE